MTMAGFRSLVTFAFMWAAFASPVAAEDTGSAQQVLPRLVIAPFGFQDTSGEPRDQKADHARRLSHSMESAEDFLAGTGLVEPALLDCRQSACPETIAGLVEQARGDGARYLLIGMFRKTSTLIGWIKFNVLDLDEEQVTCDRIVTYRGDTDEAWYRATRMMVREIVKSCLPKAAQ